MLEVVFIKTSILNFALVQHQRSKLKHTVKFSFSHRRRDLTVMEDVTAGRHKARVCAALNNHLHLVSVEFFHVCLIQALVLKVQTSGNPLTQKSEAQISEPQHQGQT